MISTPDSACDTQSKIDTLRSSVENGKLRVTTLRRNEICKLYKHLRDDAESVCNAIASDGRCSTATAEAEYRLTMDGIKKFHSSLNSRRTRLRRAEDDGSSLRLAMGLVAIRPSSHSRLYSTLIPLAAALAAGNCILLELPEDDSSVNDVVTIILQSAIKQGTVQISNARLQRCHLSQVDLLVDQNESHSIEFIPQLIGAHKSRAVAVVHQSADLPEASQMITTSRLSPHNTSPFSPSLVYVHQSAISEFREMCLAYSDDFPSPYANKSACTIAGTEIDKLLKEAECQGVVKIFHNPISGLSIVEVQPKLHRSSPILNSRIQGPYIVVVPFTSTKELVASSPSRIPLLAIYIFADIVACNSLAEQFPTNVSYCNQLPKTLLYGPASPLSHVHHLHPRYTIDMFSVPIVFSRVTDIPTEIADLARKHSRLEKIGRSFAERVSTMVVIPAVVSVAWGFWSLRRYGWRGSSISQFTFTMARSSLVRDLKGFGG